MTSLAGLRLTPRMIPPGPTARLAPSAVRSAAAGGPASGTRDRGKANQAILGEGVAIPLAVRSPHECGDDVEVPLGDVGRLAPEIGQAEVDVELEQVDSRGLLRHDNKVENASDDMPAAGE